MATSQTVEEVAKYQSLYIKTERHIHSLEAQMREDRNHRMYLVGKALLVGAATVVIAWLLLWAVGVGFDTEADVRDNTMSDLKAIQKKDGIAPQLEEEIETEEEGTETEEAPNFTQPE